MRPNAQIPKLVQRTLLNVILVPLIIVYGLSFIAMSSSFL